MMTTLLASSAATGRRHHAISTGKESLSMGSQYDRLNSKNQDSVEFGSKSKLKQNLSKKLLRKARSAESLSQITRNVKTCMSLMEMSSLSLAPSSGVLSIDSNNNKTKKGSTPSRQESHRATKRPSTERSVTKESILRAAQERVRQRRRNSVGRNFNSDLGVVHEYQRRLSDVQSWLDKNKDFMYQDFRKEFDQECGFFDQDCGKDNTQDKMLAKATNKLVEHVRDVTSKTKSSCCIGKPATNQPYDSSGKPMTQSQQQQQQQSQQQPYHQQVLVPQQQQQNNHMQQNNQYLQPQQQNNYQNNYHYNYYQQQIQQQQQKQTEKRQQENKQNQQQQQQYSNYKTDRKENVPNCVASPQHAQYPATPAQNPPTPQQMMSPDTPHYVVDVTTGTTYLRGKLLGKGGFAKCYELTDLKSNKTYAGKIISKQRLTKPHQKEKILREIELHKNLKHKHVVSFHSYFEDDDNVYIVLENCSRKSLVHCLKNRKTLTEPEVRYFMRHLIDGCRYIHRNKVIHRDLKLGNMLINESMQVKVADFGLASKVEYEGEKKMTVCGTPNYIAPEVLQKKGHSFEADIWAMGCIMYALLVGRPPFETATLKETYMRITNNRYTIPPHISPIAASLIQKLLHPNPAHRPSLDKLLFEDFFTRGFLPKQLPVSCCESAPKFPVSTYTATSNTRRPSSYAAPVTPNEAMQKISSSLAHLKGSRKSASQIITSNRTQEPEPLSPNSKQATIKETVSTPVNIQKATSADIRALPIGSAIRLYKMLTGCLENIPGDACPTPVQISKPLWVTKWVDYSNKYGFGFQLSDKSVGILFNDTTRMLLGTDGRTILYNDLSNKVYNFTTETAPNDYQKKVTLLLYFAQYMDEHLIHGGDMLQHRKEAQMPAPIFMKKWFRTSKAIIMYLSNGTLQVNFFDDHTKVILSPDAQDYLLTYINSARTASSYHLQQFRHFGCTPDVADRLRYSRRMLESIINIEGEAV